jgi:hypothetical protein
MKRADDAAVRVAPSRFRPNVPETQPSPKRRSIMNILHKAFITGLSAVALTVAGGFVAPNKAQAIDPITGVIIGGAIVGGIAATQPRVVVEPRVTVQPRVAFAAPTTTFGLVVNPNCRFERHAVLTPFGTYTYRTMRVCV